VFAVLLGAGAYADPVYSYHFYEFRNHNTTNSWIGETQLFMDVETNPSNSNQVLFTFRNEGPYDSSITGVYFDDGSLLGIAGLIDMNQGQGGDPNVDFFQEVQGPAELPGGNELIPPFETSFDPLEQYQGFSADAQTPTYWQGVNPSEWLGVEFAVNGALLNVISELETGELRVGIHVQGFSNGDSESFVNNPLPIPAPGAVVLGVLGLSLVGWVTRRLS
jgi:hypothetical protein